MTLHVEQLEPRLCAVVAAFTVNLYEDAGGVPGDLIADDTVEVGEAFFVEIMARELHPLAAGLRAVALDITWDPDVLEEIDSPFDPRQVVTRNLPAVTSGRLDNDAGVIHNLSAYSVSKYGRPIGNLRPERFALLHFLAQQPAEDSLLSMDQGRSGIVPIPVASLKGAGLYFEPQTITVDAADRVFSRCNVYGPLPLECGGRSR